VSGRSRRSDGTPRQGKILPGTLCTAGAERPVHNKGLPRMKRTVGGCYCRRNRPGPTSRLRGQRTAQAARARTGTVGRPCRGKAESAMRSHPPVMRSRLTVAGALA
jgi:hypothetical protein